MTRRNKIIYWISTVWLALGMVSTAIVQIIGTEEEIENISANLGYPPNILTIIGWWKLVGVVVILAPKLPLVKEWAYAGFFFLMTGAIFSHMSVADNAMSYFGPALLLVLTIVSWFCRPSSRRLLPEILGGTASNKMDS